MAVAYLHTTSSLSALLSVVFAARIEIRMKAIRKAAEYGSDRTDEEEALCYEHGATSILSAVERLASATAT